MAGGGGGGDNGVRYTRGGGRRRCGGEDREAVNGERRVRIGRDLPARLLLATFANSLFDERVTANALCHDIPGLLLSRDDSIIFFLVFFFYHNRELRRLILSIDTRGGRKLGNCVDENNATWNARTKTCVYCGSAGNRGNRRFERGRFFYVCCVHYSERGNKTVGNKFKF